jgi:hypothetical protein
MRKEPKKIKLTDAPSSKEVNKIPLQPIDPYKYEEVIKPDNDAIYIPIKHEDNSKNYS